MGRRQARRKKRRAEREQCIPRLDTLIIDQANFDGSWRRTQAFMSHERQGRNGGSADIVCGCDPSPRTIWRTCLNYYLEMNPARPLVPTDNPDDHNRPSRKSNKKSSQTPQLDQPAPVEYGRVFFFVHRSLPRDLWHVEYHDGPNQDMAATLFLQTQQGQIAIHSVYNVNQPAKYGRPKRHIDVERLVADTTSHGLNIVVGDFNLHRYLWGGRLFKWSNHTPAAKTLEDEMITKAKMALLTKQGTITCTRGIGDDHSTASCIDLTFVSSSLHPKVKDWGVFQDNPWKLSDYRPIRIVLDMSCVRDDSRVLIRNRLNRHAFLEAVEMGLHCLNDMALDSRQDLDAFGSTLIQIIYESIQSHTETSEPDPPELPFPDLHPNREEFEMDLVLTKLMITTMIQKLPSKKACGEDEIPNEALKLCRKLVAPYIAELFNTCIRLSYHVTAFRKAITVMLAKAALLSCLGKLFERFLAQRLKKLALDHKLLPEAQYGAPGRLTTDALKAMLAVVRKAWAWKSKGGISQFLPLQTLADHGVAT
ncbi:hypothetical protein FGADI_9136 [Fusarium gaditjirri]|uniref:Endonuclease/exonuclease/phosphatase domain-containing protein n=1 Tax=Fusarium gaditjirri TaxID=282569 RepID=A0A8H4T0J7_9HYPO|nr:hypothetical protein FGADI_9136 [Fusarium gaditjirri]